MYIKTDVEGYVKDSSSGAVLNVDNARLIAYKKQKAVFDEANKNSSRLDRVESDLSDIKNMLQTLLRENNR